MNLNENEGSESELSLVKLYMDLTGATESRARSVFMHICGEKNGITPLHVNGNGMAPTVFTTKIRATMPSACSTRQPPSEWTTFNAPVIDDDAARIIADAMGQAGENKSPWAATCMESRL